MEQLEAVYKMTGLKKSSVLRPEALSAGLLCLLITAWLLAGIFGRDPWKADEAYTFGLVHHIMQTGDRVVPTLGGEPFMEKPPLFFNLAAITAGLFSPPFQPYEAARFAVILCHLLACGSLFYASRLLNGPDKAWLAPLFYLASPGLLHDGHMLMTDMALSGGMALAYLGLAMAGRRPSVGGLILGTGTGIAFMSKGLIGPAAMGVTCLLLPLVSGAWRNRSYFISLTVAFVAVLPWLILWPALLYGRSPELFVQWFWDQNIGRFTGAREATSNATPAFYFMQLPWFALPGLPLMLWTLWREKFRGWFSREVILPLAGFVVLFAVLTVSGQKRSIYMLPLLLPVSLLAARHLESLPEMFCRGWDMLQRVLFPLLVTVVWLGWLAQLTGFPQPVWQALQDRFPGYQLTLHCGLLAVALGATVLWAFQLVRERSTRAPALLVHWTAGLTLIYLLVMTLWLPTINWNMSYRKTFVDLRRALGDYSGPVGSLGLGEPQRGLLEYYAGLTTRRAEINPACYSQCPLFLVQGDYRYDMRMGPPGPGSWQLIWEGRRSGKESFRLYRRSEVNLPQTLTPPKS